MLRTQTLWKGGRALWATARDARDGYWAVAGGAAEPEMERLTQSMVQANPPGPATVIGPNLTTEPARAAFLNGTAGTFLEMDEGNQFCKGHPGMHTIPAALAFADRTGAPGKDLLAALAIDSADRYSPPRSRIDIRAVAGTSSSVG